MTHRPGGNAAQAYLEQEIRSASPLALVAQVYDIAAQQIARARAGLAANDPAAKGVAVSRALRAIGHLQATLDMERGGEVARNLDRIYGYWSVRLTEANLHGDDAAFVEVLRHVRDLGSAWREAAQRRHAAPGAAIAEAAAAVAGAAR